MAITDVLQGIYTVANTIYTQVKLAKANKTQCQRMAERITIILTAVKNLNKIKEAEAEHFRPALMTLLTCLKECQKLIEKFSKEQSWFKQVFKAGTHKETFEALNGQLEKCIGQLNLGLNAQQIMNREQDRKDEAEDAEYIHKNLHDIKKLNEKAIQEIKIVGEKQDKQGANILARLASLNLKMSFLAQANQTNPKPQVPNPTPQVQPLIDPTLSIGYYELTLTHRLAEGSLGTVYRGYWQELDVVIKHLSFDSESNKSYQALIKEAQILSECRHSNVVSLHGVCLEPTRLCLVKEYLPQGTLASFLTRSVTSTQKQQIAIDIARGLSYLHSRKILHLNLTASHVLLTANHQAKLNAFGLSRTKAQNLKSYKPTEHVAWQAPECFKKGGASTASDVYSFGMILWTLMTGKEPFADYQGNKAELVKAISEGNRPLIPKDTAEVYKQLMEACWQTDPSKRPSLKTILQQLAACKPVDQKNLKDNKNNKVIQEVQKKQEMAKIPQLQKPPVPPLVFTPKMPSAEEHYSQGLKLEQQKKYNEAYLCYEAAVKQNHVKAYTNAGFCLLTGQGVNQNKAKAHQYFLQAAKGKHARGAYNLAEMLEHGDGVTKNLPNALHWYEEALKLGEQNEESKMVQRAKAKCEALRSQLSISYLGNLHSAASP